MKPETEIALFILKHGNILTRARDCGCDYYIASLEGETYGITMENGECIYFYRANGEEGKTK